jgi:L-ascorbate metabolism protein UlaG (beta-lactamase superfamily)
MKVFNPWKVRQDLDRARRTHGGRDWPADFKDRLTFALPSLRDVGMVMRSGGFRTDLGDVPRIPVATQASLPTVPAGRAAVTWIGHATYAVQIGGLTVLTDPVFARKIPGVPPRLTPPGVPLEGIGGVDAVVISHNHYDHLDGPTMRRLSRDTPILAPAMLGEWFRKRSFHDVTELDWWESKRIGGVRFDFVPAHHWSRRSLTDTCRTLLGGWIMSVEDGRPKIYFAGDTGYGHYFAEIGRRHPDIDLALMPVGAYEPSWFMRGQHVNPQEAVRACDDVGAPRMATMHWGTFMLSAEPLLAPIEESRAAWEATGRHREDLWDLAVGESRLLDGPVSGL